MPRKAKTAAAAPPTYGSTHRAVRHAIAVLKAFGMDTLQLQRYAESLDHAKYAATDRAFSTPAHVPPFDGLVTPAKARAAVEKALHAITQLNAYVWQSEAAAQSLQYDLETITRAERRAFLYAAAALGFDDMGREMGLDDLAVEAPGDAPGELLLGEDAYPRELLVFHLDPDQAPLTKPGDRYLIELGHPEIRLRFAVARHYPVQDGSYPGTPTRVFKGYPHLFDGQVDVLIFEEKNKEPVEHTPSTALALLRKEGASRDPLRVGKKLGFERVEEGLLQQRTLQLFLPALSRQVDGRIKEVGPRILPLPEAQLNAALHLGPSSRPLQSIPGEPSDLYLLRTEALAPVEAPAWLTNPRFLLCQITSAKDLLSGRVKYASWGDDGDRDRDAYALNLLANRKDAPPLLAPLYGFFNTNPLRPERDLTPQPRAASAFLERLDHHYHKHGQTQRPQELLRAVMG